MKSKWPMRRLSEVASIGGRTVDPRRLSDREFALYSVAAYDRDQVPDRLTRDLIRSAKVEVRRSDVLVCKLNPHIARVWLAPEEGFASTEFIPVKAGAELIPAFLRYVLLAPKVRDRLVAAAKGSTRSRQRFKPQALSEIEIPMPPLDQQCRIAAKLDAILGRFSSIAGDRAANRLALDSAADRLFERLMPLSDRTVPFGSFLTEPLVNGKSFVGAERPPGIPLLKLGAVTWGIFDRSQVKYARATVAPESRLWVRPNDVLITRSNTMELVGRAAIYRDELGPVLYPDLVIRARVDELRSDPRFLVRLFNSRLGRNYFGRVARGTSPSMKKVSQKDVIGFPVPALPLHEQSSIADECEKVEARVKNVRVDIDAADGLTKTATAAVLNRAFGGLL